MADEVKRWLPDLYRMAEKMPEHGSSASFVQSEHYDVAIAERDRLARELAAWKRAVEELDATVRTADQGVVYKFIFDAVTARAQVNRRVAELMKDAQDAK